MFRFLDFMEDWGDIGEFGRWIIIIIIVAAVVMVLASILGRSQHNGQDLIKRSKPIMTAGTDDGEVVAYIETYPSGNTYIFACEGAPHRRRHRWEDYPHGLVKRSDLTT